MVPGDGDIPPQQLGHADHGLANVLQDLPVERLCFPAVPHYRVPHLAMRESGLLTTAIIPN